MRLQAHKLAVSRRTGSLAPLKKSPSLTPQPVPKEAADTFAIEAAAAHPPLRPASAPARESPKKRPPSPQKRPPSAARMPKLRGAAARKDGFPSATFANPISMTWGDRDSPMLAMLKEPSLPGALFPRHAETRVADTA